MTDRFAAYVAIDWSGAKGRRHKGIAVAEARGDAAPRLVAPATPGRARRSSAGCSERAAREPSLFGFDFSFAPPIVERGEYLPGEPGVTVDRAGLLGLCRQLKSDEDLGAASFLERRPPQAFLLRDRRRCEGALHALPPVRRSD